MKSIVFCLFFLCGVCNASHTKEKRSCVPIDYFNKAVGNLNNVIASLVIENDLLRSGNVRKWLIFTKARDKKLKSNKTFDGSEHGELYLEL